jgi:hypothetical protein
VKQPMRRLPTFKGYTVDCRLREFRKVGERGIEFIPFDSVVGRRLLTEFRDSTMNKFIGVWTIGMLQETSETRAAVEKEFERQAKETEDWFYVVNVNGQKFFVVENGELGYTAMRPDEY